MPAECDEMEPPKVAVEMLGRDVAEGLGFAVAAGGCLDVQGAAHPIHSLSPMSNANREPVHHHARELQIESFNKTVAKCALKPLTCRAEGLRAPVMVFD